MADVSPEGAVSVPAGERLVDNGSRRMTLDELARAQPGMARLMPEIGVRVWKAYYAAEALNWPLARFQLNEAVKLMELGAFMRPKYDRSMARFLEEDFAPLGAAVEEADWPAFDRFFATMVERANHYHGVFNKSFLQWKLPDTPPPDLDLTPRS